MQSTPVVSVLMTTFGDSWPVLKRAIDSILAQSLQSFELIIVFEPNDSAFGLVKRDYTDRRLILVQCASRTGMVGAFNVGLEKAHGRYLARMDSDDYAYPLRLEKQVRHLQECADISVLGCSVRLLDSDGNHLGFRRVPTSHERIVRHLALTNPILHPTVMWDRERTGYNLRYDTRMIQEDAELWLRLVWQGHRLGNLPEVLLDYTQPVGYRRPRRVWRGGLDARLKHWRLGFRYPVYFLGMAFRFLVLLTPDHIVDSVTQRNWFSDRLRDISNEGRSSEPRHTS